MTEELFELIYNGKGESDKAEDLREKIDDRWDRMSIYEQQVARIFAVNMKKALHFS